MQANAEKSGNEPSTPNGGTPSHPSDEQSQLSASSGSSSHSTINSEWRKTVVSCSQIKIPGKYPASGTFQEKEEWVNSVRSYLRTIGLLKYVEDEKLGRPITAQSTSQSVYKFARYVLQVKELTRALTDKATLDQVNKIKPEWKEVVAFTADPNTLFAYFGDDDEAFIKENGVNYFRPGSVHAADLWAVMRGTEEVSATVRISQLMKQFRETTIEDFAFSHYIHELKTIGSKLDCIDPRINAVVCLSVYKVLEDLKNVPDSTITQITLGLQKEDPVKLSLDRFEKELDKAFGDAKQNHQNANAAALAAKVQHPPTSSSRSQSSRRSSTQPNPARNRKCLKCQKVGHFVADCTASDKEVKEIREKAGLDAWDNSLWEQKQKEAKQKGGKKKEAKKGKITATAKVHGSDSEGEDVIQMHTSVVPASSSKKSRREERYGKGYGSARQGRQRMYPSYPQGPVMMYPPQDMSTCFLPRGYQFPVQHYYQGPMQPMGRQEEEREEFPDFDEKGNYIADAKSGKRDQEERRGRSRHAARRSRSPYRSSRGSSRYGHGASRSRGSRHSRSPSRSRSSRDRRRTPVKSRSPARGRSSSCGRSSRKERSSRSRSPPQRAPTRSRSRSRSRSSRSRSRSRSRSSRSRSPSPSPASGQPSPPADDVPASPKQEEEKEPDAQVQPPPQDPPESDDTRMCYKGCTCPKCIKLKLGLTNMQSTEADVEARLEKESSSDKSVDSAYPACDDLAWKEKDVKALVNALSKRRNVKETVLMDSGAQRHIFIQKPWFTEMRKLRTPLHVTGFGARSAKADITHEGTVKLQLEVLGQKRTVVFTDVLFAENGLCNLLSESYLNEKKDMRSVALPPSLSGCGHTVWWGYKGRSFDPFIEGHVVDGLREVKMASPLTQDTHKGAKGQIVCATSIGQVSMYDLHKRCGHASLTTLQNMAKSVDGCEAKMTDEDKGLIEKCDQCAAGKLVTQPFPEHAKRRATTRNEMIHIDFTGPGKDDEKSCAASIGGNKYALIIVDNYSRFVMPHFVPNRKAKTYLPIMEVYFEGAKNKGERVKRVRADEEFNNPQFLQLCQRYGIECEFTAAKSPQQNSPAESRNRLAWRIARMQMANTGASKVLWAEALSDACDALNKLPTHANEDRTPYERWYGEKPDISRRRVWGCKAQVLDPDSGHLEPNNIESVYVGVGINSAGWRVLNLATGRVRVSRNVIFHEDVFPLAERMKERLKNVVPPWLRFASADTVNGPAPEEKSSLRDAAVPAVDNEDDDYDDDGYIGGQVPQAQVPQAQEEHKDVQKEQKVAQNASEQKEEKKDSDQAQSHKAGQKKKKHVQADPSCLALNRPHRNVKAIQRYGSYYSHGNESDKKEEDKAFQAIEEELERRGSERDKIRASQAKEKEEREKQSAGEQEVASESKDKEEASEKEVASQEIKEEKEDTTEDSREESSKAKGEPSVDALCAQLYNDPHFVKLFAGLAGIKLVLDDRDAEKGPYAELVREAKKKEMENMVHNGVFESVSRAKATANGSKPIKAKWVIVIKIDHEGKATAKARLVAKGFSQIAGVDYFDTHAPVVNSSSLMLMVALAVQNGWEIHRWDAKAAFLQAPLEETVYMEPPKGYADKDTVWHLIKSIYGLKQAAHVWHKHLTEHLLRCGWKQLRSDPCVFKLKDEGKILIGGLHVDDFHVIGNSAELREKAFANISAKYELVNEGLANSILGQQLTLLDGGLAVKLDLAQFTQAALEKFNLLDLRPVSVPMNPGTHLKKANEGEEPAMDVTEYKSHIGVLMYLSGKTRPDIAYAVMQLSRYSDCPTKEHVAALKHLWQYLSGTIDKGIVFRRSEKGLQLHMYCDADHRNDTDTGRSITGFVGMIAQGPYVYKSKLQSCVAQSTCEAEYIAMAAVSNEAKWTRMLLKELGIETGPVIVKCDNQSAIKVGTKPILNQRTKHIDTRYHVVREYLKDEVIKAEYVASADNIADIMTKPLPTTVFRGHREKLVQ